MRALVLELLTPPAGPITRSHRRYESIAFEVLQRCIRLEHPLELLDFCHEPVTRGRAKIACGIEH